MLDLAAAFPLTRYWISRLFCSPNLNLQRNILGCTFPNAVGLAAGFDKDGQHIRAMAMLGFGFIEVGTVTPLPQEGNPQPRLFRLPADRALINRMGFNNQGLDALVKRLQKLRASGDWGGVIIGGNIGKNKSTPNEQAEDDYLRCFEALFPWVDYFVVNVSSPNTPELRALQEKEPLTRLLGRLQARNLQENKPKPILLKIAPDLNEAQLDDIVHIVLHTKLAGVIATNTTVARAPLRTPEAQVQKLGQGGLSGAPLLAHSNAVLAYLRQKLGPNTILIGVGGIDSPESAQAKLDAGADLLQIYTGLIYEGPGLVRRILNHLTFPTT